MVVLSRAAIALSLLSLLSACDGAPAVGGVIDLDVCSGDEGSRVDACALDLGGVAVGSSRTKKFAIANSSVTAISLGLSLSPCADDCGDFTFDAPAEVDGGASVDVSVTFAAAVTGDVGGTLVVDSDASNADGLVVALAASGVCPLTVAPTNCNFGTVGVGNEGFCDVDVTAGDCEGVVVAAVVDGGGAFDLPNPPALPLRFQPNTTVTFTVRAAPTSTGNFIGTFTINDTIVTLRANG